MVKYLSLLEVVRIHFEIIKRFGGSHGIRDIHSFESAIGRPHANFDSTDLYPGIFNKAAALIHSLVKNHSFIDGNKRP